MALSLDEHVFAFVACPSFSALLQRLDGWLAVEILRCEQHLRRLQATTVGRDGRCICLIGQRKNGKSTIALHLLMRHHMALLGDDFSLYDPDTLTFVPHGKPLHLRGDASSLFPELRGKGLFCQDAVNSQDAVWLINPLLEFSVSPTAARGGLIVFCERDAALASEVVATPLDRTELSRRVEEGTRAWPRSAVKISQTPTDSYAGLHLHFGDSRMAAEFLAERWRS